jgi:hypothetical protein
MSKKYKVGLTVIIIFALLGISSYIYLKTKTDGKPKEIKNSDCDTSNSQTCQVDLKSATTVDSTKTKVGSFGDTVKIDQNIYLSQKLKFKLTFTPIWANAKVVETIPSDSAEGKVEFKLPTTDQQFKDKTATPLTIYVYKAGSAPKNNNLLNKISGNSQDEYYFSSWEQAPADLGAITEKEIARIAGTLEIIGQ